MKCPECGEELQPGVRVCPNCEYELSDAEMAQNGGAKPAAPEKPAAQAAQKPSVSAPERPAGYKPQKPAQPEVAMPESIMSHGDVNVSSNQDHSVHQTQNTTNNTQNNTTNNTQQTIIINVGAGGQLPGGIVDENTTRAVNEVAQQQAQQQRQRQPQQKPQQKQQADEPTFSDRKPGKNEKGVGSISGDNTIYVQTGRKMPGWLIAVIIVVVIGIAGALVFGGGKKASPEPEGQATESVAAKPGKATPEKTTPAKPAKATTTTTTTTTTTAAETTTTSSKPAATTSHAIAPAQADPYQEGMNAYNNGDYGRAVEQLGKAAAASDKKKAADAAYKLGLMYETGDGVAADKQQAIEWYQKAAKLGSKDAKRKLM